MAAELIDAAAPGGFAARAARARRCAGQIADLVKLRIGLLMMLTALAAMIVTPGPAPGAVQVAVLCLAVLLASAAAGGFNQYWEVDLDRRTARTCTRPFVTGYFRRRPRWLLVFALLLFAALAPAALLLNLAAAAWLLLGAFFYAVVYTVWLKRRSWSNIVIGGASGSFAVLAGAAAVDPVPGPLPVLLALVLFLWTPSHFWSLAIAKRRDYARTGVPMLPVSVGARRCAAVVLANTLLLVALSVAPVFFGLGAIYLAAALAGGGYFLYHNWRMLRDPAPRVAMQSFLASLLQLTLLLAGAVVDRWLLG